MTKDDSARVSAQFLERFHLSMLGVWTVVAVPGVLLWRNSLPFLVFISIYANWAGHFSSWQGARAERAGES